MIFKNYDEIWQTALGFFVFVYPVILCFLAIVFRMVYGYWNKWITRLLALWGVIFIALWFALDRKTK